MVDNVNVGSFIKRYGVIGVFNILIIYFYNISDVVLKLQIA